MGTRRLLKEGFLMKAKSGRRLYGVLCSDIMVLTDDAADERNLPTRRNIVAAMQWLAQGASAHERNVRGTPQYSARGR